MHETDRGRKFSILVNSGFSTLAFSSITSCLKAANDVVGYDAYTWKALSPEGGMVVSDVAALLNTGKISLTDMPSGENGRNEVRAILGATASIDANRRLVSWIRRGLARGVTIVSLGSATMLLAEENLLHNRRCTVHWRDMGVAVERFPEVHFTKAFYEIDGPFHTCAGDMSTFGLILRIVEADFGRDVTEFVTGETLHTVSRETTEHQKPPLHAKLERSKSPILQLVNVMEESLAEPIDIKSLIEKTALSRRQVERLFERDMGISPKKFYLQLRLNRAHELLRCSSMPIVDVSVATGFVSASHFSKAFKAAFGFVPTDCRRSSRAGASCGCSLGSKSEFREKSFAVR